MRPHSKKSNGALSHNGPSGWGRAPFVLWFALTALCAFSTVRAGYAVDESTPAAMDREADWQKRMLIYLQRDELPTIDVSPDGRNVLVLSDAFMDLGTSVERFAARVGTPDVHLPPPLVCGEGADPDNGTLVRVLNRYHVLVTQFSAFPPAVRGGVQVVALRSGGQDVIATAAFAAGQPRIRLFDTRGQLLRTLQPASDLATPYVIASGRFLDGNDEVLAVAARDRTNAGVIVDLIDANGQSVRRAVLPRPPGQGVVHLDALHETDASRLLVWFNPANRGLIADLTKPALTLRSIDVPGLDEHVVAYDSAFAEHHLVLARRDDRVRSRIDVVNPRGQRSTLDVGQRENAFFSSVVPEKRNHVRRGGYGGPGSLVPSIWYGFQKIGDPALLRSDDPRDWIAGRRGVAVSPDPILVFPFWSVWHNDWTNIGDIRDEAGFSLYNITDRDNRTTKNGAVFKGDVSIDRQLLVNSRVVAWLSARNVRGLGRDAENLIGVDSLHELGSDPDYSPRNIEQFRNFLRWRWSDVAVVNQRFSTSFATWKDLDPPRGHGRGAWDDLGKDGTGASAYASEWERYYWGMGLGTRFVDAYRDLLLAGYAPELIKNHRPGFGKDMGLAGLTMGASTGGSVYSPLPGVLHELYQVTSVNTSGQWNFTYGEYQNGWSPYEYVRLKWQWAQGLMCANMQEPYSAQMLQADGEPRPGQTGGVGQIRAVALTGSQGPTRFNIAQIGIGSERNGLLKSLTADGRFEGSTYVVPFHARVVTEVMLEESSSNDQTRRFGPLALLSHNDQIEVTVNARGAAGSGVVFQVSHEDQPLAATRQRFALTPDAARYRYVFRNQMELRTVRLLITVEGQQVALDDLTVTAQREQVAGRHGILVGTQHRGGVSFDVLDRTQVAVRPARGGLTALTPAEPTPWPSDTTKPTWIKPLISVQHPLDREIRATGWIPAIDTDYRTYLTVDGARDDDLITSYRVYDTTSGTRLSESSTTRIALPPLPPLQKQSLRVTAVDRAGNESADGPTVSFISAGCFDFATKITTQADLVTLITPETVYAPGKNGWERAGGFGAQEGSWTGETTLNSNLYDERSDRVLRLTVPEGRYRVSPLIAGWEHRPATWTISCNGKEALSHWAPQWVASVEPFVAAPIKGTLTLTLPRTQCLLGLVIVPARTLTQMTWSNPRAPTAAFAYQPLGEDKAPYIDAARARLRLDWPTANGPVRHYKVLIDNRVAFATNLTWCVIEDLPVDTRLQVRIDAVDADGNVLAGKTQTCEFDSRLTALLEIRTTFPKNDWADGEVFLNGKPLASATAYARGTMHAVTLVPGRNVLAVRTNGTVPGPKVYVRLNRTGQPVDLADGWRASIREDNGWQRVDFDDRGWTTPTMLDRTRFQDHDSHVDTVGTWIGVPRTADTPDANTGWFRVSFDVPANGPRGGPVSNNPALAVRRVETLMQRVVVQQVEVTSAPMRDAVAQVNRQLRTSGTTLTLAVDDTLAAKPVTLTTTNIYLGNLAQEFARQLGGTVVAHADGRVRVQAK